MAMSAVARDSIPGDERERDGAFCRAQKKDEQKGHFEVPHQKSHAQGGPSDHH